MIDRIQAKVTKQKNSKRDTKIIIFRTPKPSSRKRKRKQEENKNFPRKNSKRRSHGKYRNNNNKKKTHVKRRLNKTQDYKTINVISSGQDFISDLCEIFQKYIHKPTIIKPDNNYKIQTSQKIPKLVTVPNLQEEIRRYKTEIRNLKQPIKLKQEDKTNQILSTIDKVIYQKWEVFFTIVIKSKYILEINALIDSRAALNCIREGLVPTKFYKKTC